MMILWFIILSHSPTTSSKSLQNDSYLSFLSTDMSIPCTYRTWSWVHRPSESASLGSTRAYYCTSGIRPISLSGPHFPKPLFHPGHRPLPCVRAASFSRMIAWPRICMDKSCRKTESQYVISRWVRGWHRSDRRASFYLFVSFCFNYCFVFVFYIAELKLYFSHPIIN